MIWEVCSYLSLGGTVVPTSELFSFSEQWALKDTYTPSAYILLNNRDGHSISWEVGMLMVLGSVSTLVHRVTVMLGL